MKKLLTGNEAVAISARLSDVKFASGYPGTPSTEILENISNFKEIHSRWCPNEKVALETAIGASYAGARSIVTMKHVGLNVASDPLMTLAYTGINAGLVIVSCDDPGMHSSQNEQDNRFYAKFAKIPMLLPSDSSEAFEFTALAFHISEKTGSPVILRMTTRISHTKTVVESEIDLSQYKQLKTGASFCKNSTKYVMLPANAKIQQKDLISRFNEYKNLSENIKINVFEEKGPGVLVVTEGVSYNYVRENAPDVSVFKIGMYPAPVEKIKNISKNFQNIIVCEELEPFFEDELKVAGINVKGKEYFPAFGEFTPDIVSEGMQKAGIISKAKEENIEINLPARPPQLCAGCAHRTIFYMLRKLKLNVTGDIGCYTLGALEPLKALDTCLCMGAGIGQASGIDSVSDNKSGNPRTVAVIGDSTFIHSGITGLIDIVYSKTPTIVIILDNSTTAMTGRQNHPGTGFNIKGEPSSKLDLLKLCKSIGADHVEELDPYNVKQVELKLKQAISRNSNTVFITTRPCVLLDCFEKGEPSIIDDEKCIACGICLNIGCPAIISREVEGKKKTSIDAVVCNSCGVCVSLCPKDSIIRKKKK